MLEYKGYNIAAAGRSILKCIKPVGKGSVPKEFRDQLFTSDVFAKQAIDMFFGKKGKTDGKTDK